MKRLSIFVFVIIVSLLLSSCAYIKVNDNESFANNVNNADTDKTITANNEEPDNVKTYEKIIMDYNEYKKLARLLLWMQNVCIFTWHGTLC